MLVPKIAIIGPRRLRQGLGPFVARALKGAGAEISCFLCSKESNVKAASDELTEIADVVARGYFNFGSMLEAEDLHALAILSPKETHQYFLEGALRNRLHVFCEKPLVWGESNPSVDATVLIEEFGRQNLLLMENSQWPETLKGFLELHPEALDCRPREFSMRLSPRSEGLEMIVDSLSHPLSLLQAWTAYFDPAEQDCRVESPTFKRYNLSGVMGISVSFQFVRGSAAVSASVDLVQQVEQPRIASYSLNGFVAERLVDMSDYSMFFSDRGRRIALEDPLTLRAARFARELQLRIESTTVLNDDETELPQATEARELKSRMVMLEELVEAFVDYNSHRKYAVD